MVNLAAYMSHQQMNHRKVICYHVGFCSFKPAWSTIVQNASDYMKTYYENSQPPFEDQSIAGVLGLKIALTCHKQALIFQMR